MRPLGLDHNFAKYWPCHGCLVTGGRGLPGIRPSLLGLAITALAVVVVKARPLYFARFILSLRWLS